MIERLMHWSLLLASRSKLSHMTLSNMLTLKVYPRSGV